MSFARVINVVTGCPVNGQPVLCYKCRETVIFWLQFLVTRFFPFNYFQETGTGPALFLKWNHDYIIPPIYSCWNLFWGAFSQNPRRSTWLHVAPRHSFSLDRRRKQEVRCWGAWHNIRSALYCLVLLLTTHHSPLYSPRFNPLTRYTTLCVWGLYRHQHLLRSHVSFNKCHRLPIASRTATSDECHRLTIASRTATSDEWSAAENVTIFRPTNGTDRLSIESRNASSDECHLLAIASRSATSDECHRLWITWRIHLVRRMPSAADDLKNCHVRRMPSRLKIASRTAMSDEWHCQSIESRDCK